MRRPGDMEIADWNAFADFAATQNTHADRDADEDVRPWLVFWRAALMWAREGRIP